MLKKYTNGSWSEIKYKKYGNKAEEFAEFPVTIRGDGNDLTDYSISGNMSQASGVSPDSSIQPQETGERTGNLYPLDESKLHVGRIENDGTIGYKVGTLTVGTNSVTYEADTTWRGFYTDFIQVNENEKLTFSPNNSSTIAWSCSCYDENDNYLGKATAQSTAYIRTFTLLTGTKKVRMSVTSSDTTYTILRPMLNLGSTALPYENFGYKIPITVKDFSCTILGVQQSTNYAYISKSDLPNASVGDYISTTIEGVDYSLAIMQIDDNYIYIENRTV